MSLGVGGSICRTENFDFDITGDIRVSQTYIIISSDRVLKWEKEGCFITSRIVLEK